MITVTVAIVAESFYCAAANTGSLVEGWAQYVEAYFAWSFLVFRFLEALEGGCSDLPLGI